MTTGQIISGLGHLGLIAWVLWGGTFRTDPLPFEVTEVAVISAADFAALSQVPAGPESVTEVAMPQSPEIVPEPVDTPAADAEVKQASPEQTAQPEAESVPEEILPEPEPEVSEAAPEAPTPPADLSVDAPQTADVAVPRPVDRVAPNPVETPDPEAAPDLIEQAAVAPDKAPELPQQPEREATAPEAAATEIVTEAETPSAAPRTSLRPPARRPARPVRTAQAPDTPAPTPSTEDAVAAAVAAAMSTSDTAPETPRGPPLSAGERDALRVAVSSCWNVGSLSSDAMRTVVTVAVSMTPDGKPVVPSIRMLSREGGSDASARQAFETAKRAIIRCTRGGYALPADKYAQWKEIEMTFNPERMRIR